MLKEIIKIANYLDSKGLTKEADYLDAILKAASLEDNLALLDEALATLNALRAEMDPDLESDFDDEDEPKDEWQTETAWNSLHKGLQSKANDYRILSVTKNATRKQHGYNISIEDARRFAKRFGFKESATVGTNHETWVKRLSEPIEFNDGTKTIITDRLFISFGRGKPAGYTLRPAEARDIYLIAKQLGREALMYFSALTGWPIKSKEGFGSSEASKYSLFYSSWALPLVAQIKADLNYKTINPKEYFEVYLPSALKNDLTIDSEEAEELIVELANIIEKEREEEDRRKEEEIRKQKEEERMEREGVEKNEEEDKKVEEEAVGSKAKKKKYFISKINISEFLTAIKLLGDNSAPEDIAGLIDVNPNDEDFIETKNYLIRKGFISSDEKGLSIINSAVKDALAHTQNNDLFKLSKKLFQKGLKKEAKLLLKIIKL